ncbi:TatD family hydrolase [Virgibacillus xinjiangensis]|uniref:TatD family hydrolase n=1 Tax=Virgibacillus xinjiangensis TaxID=393090 RepID=A0ABV7CQL4_9BACI
MLEKIIDAHIHLDAYKAEEREIILQDMAGSGVEKLIAVSSDRLSAQKNLSLSRKNPDILPAFGFHPEQRLPSEEDLADLFQFIRQNSQEMTAVGEVGLPHYLRREDPILPLEPCLEVLETFIQLAVQLEKPIVLHAVYEDAPIVCDLLEKHSVRWAHFHWFKGDHRTMERMVANGYFVSVTPDILYKQRTQNLVRRYPLGRLMVETDGPWPFEGPFLKQMTHPKMIHLSVRTIAECIQQPVATVYEQLLANTRNFYRIS